MEKPPPINLTTSLNLLKFQAEVKAITKDNFFEFRNTKNGIRVVGKGMADYSAVMRHHEERKLPFFI
jgi:hypothetical protein